MVLAIIGIVTDYTFRPMYYALCTVVNRHNFNTPTHRYYENYTRIRVQILIRCE